MASLQRFKKATPCPICSGYDGQHRGQGKRCHGFISSDGRYAHCSREEHAGAISVSVESSTYAHLLEGECNCGISHGTILAPIAHIRVNGKAKSNGKASKRPWIDPGSLRIGLKYPDENGVPRTLTDIYEYVDENGAPLHRTLRFRYDDGEKTFSQCEYVTGRWQWGLQNVRRVLYRLDELNTLKDGELVFLCEGEKDADAVRELGLYATTNPMGAGKWSDEYSVALARFHVAICCDNDEKGRDHGSLVSKSLREHGVTQGILALTGLPEKGDAYDWIDQGGAARDLVAIVEVALEQPLTDEVRRALRQLFSLPRQEDSNQPKEISNVTDAVSFVLVAAAVPEKFRSYIDAVIGAANGELEWFEAPDCYIGMRARVTATHRDPNDADVLLVEPLKKESMERWARRNRKDFIEWQKAAGITIIEAEPGGKIEGSNKPTRYRLPVLRLANETLEAARLDQEFETNPRRALRRAAAAIVKEQRLDLITPPRRERFRRSRRTADTYRKMCLTYAGKFYRERSFRHPDRAEEELEAIIAAIREHQFEEENS
jgi:hypothetical protein